MNELFLDLETFSSVDLGKCGVYKYAASPDFEILLFAYSVDGGEVQVVDIASGEDVPDEILAALEDDKITKWSYNVNFERVCLSAFLNYPIGEFLSPSAWRCSMIWAAYLGLPQSLAGAGAVLQVDKKKLEEGKDLIRYFCVPCKGTKANGGRERNCPKDAPDKWELFKKYNKRDVETEMEIQKKLGRFPVPESVWEEFVIDQEINDRGILVDMEMVENAIRIDEKVHEELKDRMKELTELNNPQSVQQLRGWLADNGLEMDSLGKDVVKEAVKTAPEPLREVLTLRQQISKSSVKKYVAMENVAGADNRARGTFRFYGANRSGRFSGRNIQLQNLPQNHLPDLEEARALVKAGDYETLSLLYDDIPDTLSQLIRTAFIPSPGKRYYVADFSSIEARVLSWIAGEQWRIDAFREGKDIYCMSASSMFGVPVEKHGVNGELRAKGKVAELACIAEGSLVLTDKGLIPIEQVTLEEKLWDGEEWVSHEGVIEKGIGEAIEYEGLRATADHPVWIEGQQRPVRFGDAATSGAHLVQTGNGRYAVRLGEDYKPGEALEQNVESVLCSDRMPGMRSGAMADSRKPDQGTEQRLSAVQQAEADSKMAGSEADSGKAEMRESERPGVSQVRRQRDSVCFSKCSGSGIVSHKGVRSAGQGDGNRPDRQQRKLCSGEHSLCHAHAEQPQQEMHGLEPVRAEVLAVCPECGYKETVCGADTGRDYSGCGDCCIRETEELAHHIGKVRLYDIRNAGRHHRFTVSGRLVHNCGYGGSVGAMKAMGAGKMGLSDDEIQEIVTAWRNASPNIVKFWWDIDRAVMQCMKEGGVAHVKCIKIRKESGMLIITLPSGRELFYVKPRIGENKFGSECVTYEGREGAGKWGRVESYGPKFVENIIQGIARDILCYAMRNLRDYDIVAHVHDEIILEAPPQTSLEEICELMGRTPPWAEGLLLRADGFVSDFYKKDD